MFFAQASYDDVIPGAKLTVSGVLEGGKAIKDMAAPKISTEYKKDNLVASVSVEGSSLSAGGVVEFGDIQVQNPQLILFPMAWLGRIIACGTLMPDGYGSVSSCKSLVSTNAACLCPVFYQFQVGASGSYNADDGSMGDPSFAARYKGGNFGITAVLKGLKVRNTNIRIRRLVSLG